MADEAGEIEAAAEHFIRALDDLEWDQFAACWLPDSTAFFPGEDALLTDREAVLARFRRIFDHTDRSMGPPSLRLRPRNLRAFQCGDAGLVTFTLGAAPDTVALRTYPHSTASQLLPEELPWDRHALDVFVLL